MGLNPEFKVLDDPTAKEEWESHESIKIYKQLAHRKQPSACAAACHSMTSIASRFELISSPRLLTQQ